jgi:hypothetical protein
MQWHPAIRLSPSTTAGAGLAVTAIRLITGCSFYALFLLLLRASLNGSPSIIATRSTLSGLPRNLPIPQGWQPLRRAASALAGVTAAPPIFPRATACGFLGLSVFILVLPAPVKGRAGVGYCSARIKRRLPASHDVATGFPYLVNFRLAGGDACCAMCFPPV